jgi:hypothetical protein
MIFCPCGMTIDRTATNYSVASYDSFGNLIYAVCMHGIVVVDKRLKVDLSERRIEDDDGYSD